ncbi:primase-helicase zinc-binding domain-containing protein, partial [Serratia sp. Ag2]|uniref:primase-helicase zinc-binding domain-containing protein n=1 Tax=Serratia sp. Ag2 TaxID=1532556 RepID=UPI000504251C
MRNIDLIREVTKAAAGRWPDVLPMVGIDVPASQRAQVACPACGGRDRFRFDDNGRGSHFCNQCGAGDGLDLIQKVKQCDATEAARLVADVLGIAYRAEETSNQTHSQSKAAAEADRQQRKQDHLQEVEAERARRKALFNRRWKSLIAGAVEGRSAYLNAKGLTGFTFPMLADGRLLVELTDETGIVAAAQTITPTGEKRQVTDGAKRGAFHILSEAPQQSQTVILAEGLATALSVHLMRPDAVVVVAIDAGNLLLVAEVIRRKYPDAQVIIAGDNDWHLPGELDEHGRPKKNGGKIGAEKAAAAVSGWVSVPPTEHKADWDDYRQKNGLEAATQAFNNSLYKPKGESVTAQLKAIEGGKQDNTQRDPLKPHVVSRKDGVFWITPQVDKLIRREIF